MDIIFIIGDSACGKMTVGQEIAKQTEYKLFYNHLTIEPVLEVFGEFNLDVITRLRYVFFEEFAYTEEKGVIITMMVDFNEILQIEYIQEIVSFFKKIRNDINVYCVELRADLETRLKRNKTENRLLHKASKRDIEASEARLIKDTNKGKFVSNNGEEMKDIFNDNYIIIDNNNLEAIEVCDIIIEKFNLPINKQSIG